MCSKYDIAQITKVTVDTVMGEYNFSHKRDEENIIFHTAV